MIVVIPPEKLLRMEACALAFFAESREPGAPNFPGWMKKWAQFIGTGIGVMFAWVEEGEEQARGVCAGLLSPDLLTDDLKAQEIYLFVRPEYRGIPGARVAGELVRRFETWARGRGARTVTFGAMTHLSPGVERYYRRLGYRPLEAHFVKSLT